jgi:hypothetical protein
LLLDPLYFLELFAYGVYLETFELKISMSNFSFMDFSLFRKLFAISIGLKEEAAPFVEFKETGVIDMLFRLELIADTYFLD